MEQFIAVAKALSDPNRIRALAALRDGELCACQVIALLDLAPSTVSKHMSVLKQAGLVKSRKEERWIHYRLPGKDASDLAREALELLFRTVAKDAGVQEDRIRLGSILKRSPVDICKTVETV